MTIITHEPSYWVVVPAAGSGRRMRSKSPKQYLKINHQTLIEHTVSVLAAHPLLLKIVVVLHADDTQWSTINIGHPEKIVTAVGGDTRAISVMRGLEYLQPMAAANDWVLVHDAARPCLSPKVLNRFITTVADHRIGGLLALPITDTIKRVDTDHCVRETISREGLWAAQTPQMFRYGLLFDAIKQSLNDGMRFTDESSAVEWAGEHPLAVLGDWRNIKVTEPEDLLRATAYLSEQNAGA